MDECEPLPHSIHACLLCLLYRSHGVLVKWLHAARGITLARVRPLECGARALRVQHRKFGGGGGALERDLNAGAYTRPLISST